MLRAVLERVTTAYLTTVTVRTNTLCQRDHNVLPTTHSTTRSSSLSAPCSTSVTTSPILQRMHTCHCFTDNASQQKRKRKLFYND